MCNSLCGQDCNFFGVKDYRCYVNVTVDFMDDHEKDSQGCEMPCPGDNNVTCGGTHGRIEVFQKIRLENLLVADPNDENLLVADPEDDYH